MPSEAARAGDATSPVAAWRYLVPNLFTAASAALGLVACILAIEGRPVWGAWAILWCVLLDKVDGTAARLLHSTSAFGTQFDSMADLISFGVAPAVLVYAAGRQVWGIRAGSPEWWLLALGCGLFALLAAVRLARFNACDSGRPIRIFTGIPSTLCGALVPAALLVAMKYQLGLGLARFIPVGMGLLGLGMVSRIPVPKVTRRKNRALQAFQIANLVGVYVCGILVIWPEYILGLTVVYLVVGAGWGIATAPGSEATN